MSSKKQSASWSAINTGIAFVISFLAHYFIVSELLVYFDAKGWPQTGLVAAGCVTLFYTVLSFARNYYVDRIREEWKRRNGIVEIEGQDMPIMRQ